MTAWDLASLVRPLPRPQSAARQQPTLLPHYPALIEYVFQERFVLAFQLYRRFAEVIHSPRTARYQLNNLVRLGYVASAVLSLPGRNRHYCYFALNRGIHLVKDTYGELGLPWTPTAGEEHKQRGVTATALLHEVETTEFDLAVYQTLKRRPDLALLTTERRYFKRDRELRFTDTAGSNRVVPDAGFLVRLAGQGLLWCAVEVDNGTLSTPRLLDKFQLYARWADSAEGQAWLTGLARRFDSDQPPLNFRVLVVAHDQRRQGGDERRLVELLAVALTLPASIRDKLWLVTTEELQRCQHDEVPLGAATWRRARGTKHWLPAWREAFTEPPSGRQNVRAMWQGKLQFVTERLDELPLHPLFPHPISS